MESQFVRDETHRRGIYQSLRTLFRLPSTAGTIRSVAFYWERESSGWRKYQPGKFLVKWNVQSPEAILWIIQLPRKPGGTITFRAGRGGGRQVKPAGGLRWEFMEAPTGRGFCWRSCIKLFIPPTCLYWRMPCAGMRLTSGSRGSCFCWEKNRFEGQGVTMWEGGA